MIARPAALSSFLLTLANPALAHMGDHSRFALPEMAAHLLEWDHLFFLGLAGVIGIMAFRAGRRLEARRIHFNRRRD
jgi:hypothetical protein